jgi:hypothetical protein
MESGEKPVANEAISIPAATPSSGPGEEDIPSPLSTEPILGDIAKGIWEVLIRSFSYSAAVMF